MMYQHLFFDLDHTLWDFERNSTETLGDLVTEHGLLEKGGFTMSEFMKTFREVNHHLWSRYNKGQITRDEIRTQRFDSVFEQLGLDKEDQPKDLSEQYLMACPQKAHVLPYTFEALDYLKGKGYKLHIITNGFDDVQAIKLKASKLVDYFPLVVTSETSGHKKPQPDIFWHALRAAGADVQDSLMIGDNLETDIKGARGVTMDTMFYNPDKHFHQEEVTYEIDCLSRIQAIL